MKIKQYQNGGIWTYDSLPKPEYTPLAEESRKIYYPNNPLEITSLPVYVPEGQSPDNTKVDDWKNDKLLNEYFNQDVLPRYYRETHDAPNTIRLAQGYRNNRASYFYDKDSITTARARIWGEGSPRVEYNMGYNMSRPTIAHEKTHLGRQYYIGGSRLDNTGYNETETNYLRDAYDLSDRFKEDTPKDRFLRDVESGATTTEARYKFWRELYKLLGRIPTLEETDNYIKKMPTHTLLNKMKNVNGYSGASFRTKQRKGIKRDVQAKALKDALIHVAQNNTPERTDMQFAKYGARLKRK